MGSFLFADPPDWQDDPGCCQFTSMEIINQLNGFDENFNMYMEDVDFCLRAKKIGIKCYYWPDAKLWHHVSASMGGEYSLRKIIKKLISYYRILLNKHSYNLY